MSYWLNRHTNKKCAREFENNIIPTICFKELGKFYGPLLRQSVVKWVR